MHAGSCTLSFPLILQLQNPTREHRLNIQVSFLLFTGESLSARRKGEVIRSMSGKEIISHNNFN